MITDDGKRIYFRSEQKFHRVGLVLEWPQEYSKYQTISACNKFSRRGRRLPKLYEFEDDSGFKFCKNCTKPSAPNSWVSGEINLQGEFIRARKLTRDEVLEIYASYEEEPFW